MSLERHLTARGMIMRKRQGGKPDCRAMTSISREADENRQSILKKYTPHSREGQLIWSHNRESSTAIKQFKKARDITTVIEEKVLTCATDF